MGAYDTMTAGLSGAGLALLSIITVHGTSEYHLNAEQMLAELQGSAEQALVDAGQTWATVEMQGQVAVLTGAPPSVEAAETAQAAVLSSSGQGGILWGGVWRVDSQFEEIRDIPTASPYVWRAIKSPNGSVILVGSAPDEAVQSDLANYAGQISSEPLDDRMKLALGVPEGDWAGLAKFGLDQLSLLNSGEARLTDTELRLSGIAMEGPLRIQALASVDRKSVV